MGFWSKLFGSKRQKRASGYSPEDPLMCSGPAAEREIIESLRCPNGHRLRFRRLGSTLGRCPEPSGHRSIGDDDCIVDKFFMECTGGEHTCSLYFDMYHPSAPWPETPEGLKSARERKAGKLPTITLHYEDGRPVWKITVVQPSRFREVPYEIIPRLFTLPSGALLGILLNLYDVPDQPYFIHRVMDLSDPEVERYIGACVRDKSLLAVFEAKGTDKGFTRDLKVDVRAWEACLRQGLRHNGKVELDGEEALKVFLDVFNQASRERGVEHAWNEVDRNFRGPGR